MTEPTPRQWCWINSNWKQGRAGRLFDSASGNLIIETDGKFLYLTKEHACLIVTAVNCHDELVDALQWFVDRVDKGEVRSKRTYARFKELLAKVRELETGG